MPQNSNSFSAVSSLLEIRRSWINGFPLFLFCKDFSLDPLGWLGCQRENVSGGSVAEIFINFIVLVVVDGPPIWNCRRVDAEKIRQLPLEARFSTCLIVWRAYAEKNATLFIGKSNHNCSSLASFLSPLLRSFSWEAI